MSAPFVSGATSTSALVAALAIGVAFGWFLERGGMGNARKLAAQFFLADFTVIKVLFSALITAMVGAFVLTRIGVLDASRLYVPETYLAPQLVGGALFGVGFAIVGLCPGTSCVAGASGKLDGLAAIAGLLLGVLAFAEADWLADFYGSTPRGVFTLPELLGIHEGAVVAGVLTMAAALFAVAERMEKRK
ncbi:MAG TPA: YeeE/YedE thiosulfate transporter family protein [Thermoanaerobaculia bacterium]